MASPQRQNNTELECDTSSLGQEKETRKTHEVLKVDVTRVQGRLLQVKGLQVARGLRFYGEGTLVCERRRFPFHDWVSHFAPSFLTQFGAMVSRASTTQHSICVPEHRLYKALAAVRWPCSSVISSRPQLRLSPSGDNCRQDGHGRLTMVV